MSVRVMGMVWDNGPAKASERLMLLAIADHANDDGEAFPGVERLAAKCCVTIRPAQNTIRALEADGWITVEVGGGRKNTNFYRVNLAKLRESTPTPLSTAPGGEGNPAVHDRNPAVSMQETPLPTAPEPSVEPSGNRHGAALPLPPMEGKTESFALKAPVESTRKARATRMPDGFMPDPALVAWTKENCPDIDAKYEWSQFVDHAAATDRRMVDWRKAWMTWARKAQQWKRERGQQQKAAQKRDMSALWIKQDFGNPLEGIK